MLVAEFLNVLNYFNKYFGDVVVGFTRMREESKVHQIVRFKELWELFSDLKGREDIEGGEIVFSVGSYLVFVLIVD